MDNSVGDLLKEWDPYNAQWAKMAQAGLAAHQAAKKPQPKVGTMKIEIERIVNGWLVTGAGTAYAGDPLAQRGPQGKHFADTPEAICGMIAEWVLEECKRQEG